MKYLILIVTFFITGVISVKAQVKGIILDNQNQPLEYANVVLLTTDSLFVDGAISNANGFFSVSPKGSNAKNYFLSISFSGYEQQTILLNNLPGSIDLGNIVMQSATLNEVIVTTSRSISKTDRQLIFPTKQIVKSSTSGYDMLNKLMLPGLKVDIVNKSIAKMGGGNVQIYINDKKATQADVITMRPDEVIRVEYIDAPGVQYANDNVEAVVHFIVRRRISGVVAGINTTNAITTGNGNNVVFLKYNHNQSELGINYSNNYGVVDKRYINQTDVYTLADNTEHIVDRKGLNTHLKYVQHRMQLTYNLSVPKKYVFEANFRGVFYDSPNRGHQQRISETGKPIYFSITEPTEKYHSPVIDLFYRVNLPNKQVFTANLVGTMIDTKYGYSYKTFSDESFSTPINEYGYQTIGEKYSLIGEIRYNKQFDAFSFITGIDHLEGYTRNQYTGIDNILNKMNNATTYLYSQLQGALGKVNYIAGAGISYQTYKQGEGNYKYWLFRPSLTLSYMPFKGANIRNRFYIKPRIPSLSSLSDVRQQANDIEFRLGNPNLKPYWDATNMLIFSYQYKRLYIENTFGYTYSHKPIMEEIVRKTDNAGKTFFEFGFDNQKSSNQLWNYLAGQYYVIPDKLAIQGGISFQTYKSNGNNYAQTHNHIWGILQADLMLDKWNIGANWNSREKSLSGETISFGQKYSNLYVNYQLKNITLGANWSYILMKNGHTSGEKTISRFVNKKLNVFVPDWANMISVSFSWNLNKGRKYQSQRKTINNSDTDSGIFKY